MYWLMHALLYATSILHLMSAMNSSELSYVKYRLNVSSGVGSDEGVLMNVTTTMGSTDNLFTELYALLGKHLELQEL